MGKYRPIGNGVPIINGRIVTEKGNAINAYDILISEWAKIAILAQALKIFKTPKGCPYV